MESGKLFDGVNSFFFLRIIRTAAQITKVDGTMAVSSNFLFISTKDTTCFKKHIRDILIKYPLITNISNPRLILITD